MPPGAGNGTPSIIYTHSLYYMDSIQTYELSCTISGLIIVYTQGYATKLVSHKPTQQSAGAPAKVSWTCMLRDRNC